MLYLMLGLYLSFYSDVSPCSCPCGKVLGLILVLGIQFLVDISVISLVQRKYLRIYRQSAALQHISSNTALAHSIISQNAAQRL